MIDSDNPSQWIVLDLELLPPDPGLVSDDATPRAAPTREEIIEAFRPEIEKAQKQLMARPEAQEYLRAYGEVTPWKLLALPYDSTAAQFSKVANIETLFSRRYFVFSVHTHGERRQPARRVKAWRRQVFQDRFHDQPINGSPIIQDRVRYVVGRMVNAIIDSLQEWLEERRVFLLEHDAETSVDHGRPIVFVSHSSRDNATVLPICEAINARCAYDAAFSQFHPPGILFVDAWCLRGGEIWRRALARSLAYCHGFILFYSRDYAKSPRCVEELVAHRSRQNAPILVISLDTPIRLQNPVKAIVSKLHILETQKVGIERLIGEVFDWVIREYPPAFGDLARSLRLSPTEEIDPNSSRPIA